VASLSHRLLFLCDRRNNTHSVKQDYINHSPSCLPLTKAGAEGGGINKSSSTFKNWYELIGCMGNITFQIFGEVDLSIIKPLNALADFELFSRIGRKTPMGIGQARHLT
jgi:hypothetical protein